MSTQFDCSQAGQDSQQRRKALVERFLGTLFGAYFADREAKGVICITGIEQPKPADRPPRIRERFFRSIADVIAALPELEAWHASGLDIYVCVNPLLQSHRSIENVAAQVCVHVDLDDTQAMPACPLEPSIVVASGHGLQPFWILEEPISLDHSMPAITKIFRDDATQRNKRFAAMLGADHCHDLARLMRLPGFTNRKREPAVPVQLLSVNGQPYSAAMLDAIGDSTIPIPQREKQPPVEHGPGLSLAKPKRGDCVSSVDVELEGLPGDLAARLKPLLLDDRLIIGRRWRGDTKFLKDDSRSGIDMSLASALAWQGFTAEEIAAVLRAAPYNRDAEKPAGYWLRTAQKAVDDVAAERSRNQSKRSKNAAAAEPVIVTFSDIEPEPVKWLWKDRIPLGAVTLFAGDPGLGKSMIAAADIAARVSRGLEWPEESGKAEPGDVIILSAEDSPSHTLRPRLDAAGADMSRVNLLKAVRVKASDGNESERMFSLETDIAQLREARRRYPNTKLIVVDPISAYTGKTDTFKDAPVRQLLAPLATFAAEAGIAIIAIKHLNKNEERSAMYRASDSIAFVAAARAVWMFAKDKANPGQYVMTKLKLNLCADPGGLGYRIVECKCSNGVTTARIEWHGKRDVDAEEALRSGPQGERLDEAKTFLTNLLERGPVPEKEIEKQAREAGISGATVRRAKDALGVRSEKVGFGFEGEWEWRLPDEYFADLYAADSAGEVSPATGDRDAASTP